LRVDVAEDDLSPGGCHGVAKNAVAGGGSRQMFAVLSGCAVGAHLPGSRPPRF
jgi:hypothetical protein